MKKLLIVLMLLGVPLVAEGAVFTGAVTFNASNGLVLEKGDTGRYIFDYKPEKQKLLTFDTGGVYYRLFGSSINFQADKKPLSFEAKNLDMIVNHSGMGVSFWDAVPNIKGAPDGTFYDDLFITLPTARTTGRFEDQRVNQNFLGFEGEGTFGSAIWNETTVEEYELSGIIRPNGTAPIPEPISLVMFGTMLVATFRKWWV